MDNNNKDHNQTQMLTYLKENMSKLYINQNGQSRIIRMGGETNKDHKNTEISGVLTYAAALTKRFNNTNHEDISSSEGSV